MSKDMKKLTAAIKECFPAELRDTINVQDRGAAVTVDFADIDIPIHDFAALSERLNLTSVVCREMLIRGNYGQEPLTLLLRGAS